LHEIGRPWFYRKLSIQGVGDFEVRICKDEGHDIAMNNWNFMLTVRCIYICIQERLLHVCILYQNCVNAVSSTYYYLLLFKNLKHNVNDMVCMNWLL